MKHLLITCALLLPLMFSPAKAVSKNTKEQTKVRNMIASLPEVIEAGKYVSSHAHGKRHLVTFIDGSPNARQNYYVLTVGEYNGMNMVPHFKFIVYATTYVINYWDVANGKYIPLKQWRRQLAVKG